MFYIVNVHYNSSEIYLLHYTILCTLMLVYLGLRIPNKIHKSLLVRNQDSEVEADSNGDLQIASPGNSEAQQALVHFWPKVMEEIKNITTVSKTI